MDTKSVVILIGVLLAIAGIFLIVTSEVDAGPADEFSPATEASENANPHLWEGIALIVVGALLVAVAEIRMV